MKAQKVDNTGEIIGPPMAPYQVLICGWVLNNTSGSAVIVDFYTVDGTTDGRAPAAPSASGDKIFSITVPANSSKEFLAEQGIYLTNGCFVKTGASGCVGSVFYR